MKKFFFLFVALTSATLAFAQKPAASPAATAEGTINGAKITVKYAQPAVKGRKIWGDLVPFDQVWRTGANGATTIELSKAVKVEGKELAAGKYAIFSIPTENGDWTIIFNKKADQWGAYNYSDKEDALRVKVKATKAKESVERLTFAVKEKSVVFNWELAEVAFGVE